ncbi:MAG: exonuclease SbcCD subunit D [Methanomassiliicoccales archaeon]|nr:MAG: exonuclease SbcCD subunit D [Methanomassiliicoccales archaeon]
MKIAHISDTHLGFSAYRKVDEETGMNQREIDIYRAFQRSVDAMISERVDLVLHSGDLFDTVRPSNRAISFAMEQFVRLTKAGAKVVVIAGNHSTPRMRETGSVFKIFEHLPGVRPVYQGIYETVDVGEVIIHAVPHADRDEMTRELDKVIPVEGRLNVLMLHAGIAGVDVHGGVEHNEQVLPSSYLKEDMDYIALGHYHDMKKVSDNAYYSGSTERLSFAEVGQRKGFILLDTDGMRVEERCMPVRPMFDLTQIDAKGKDANEVMAEARSLLEGVDLKGALVRLNVKRLTGAQYRSLDLRSLRQLANGCVHFELRFDMTTEDVSVQADDISITDLEGEFASYIDGRPVEGVPKERVARMGLEYLRRGLEGSG